jgi:hypothetical protein
MAMPQLPADWEDTRTTLQAYAKALTAFPRAAGIPDDRWNYVAMTVNPVGLATAPTPLGDGTQLVGTIDLVTNEVVIAAGDDVQRLDMTTGPSSVSVGEAMLATAARHGSDIEVDEDRLGGTDRLLYNSDDARAFFASISYVNVAFEQMNASLSGEIDGPHLWPHGFDIVTEWYSTKKVPYGDGEAPAQIAVGFYPANESYFYANPWPYQEAWGEEPPFEGSSWHLEGWQGVVIPPDGMTTDTIAGFGASVHDLAKDSLSG